MLRWPRFLLVVLSGTALGPSTTFAFRSSVSRNFLRPSAPTAGASQQQEEAQLSAVQKTGHHHASFSAKANELIRHWLEFSNATANVTNVTQAAEGHGFAAASGKKRVPHVPVGDYRKCAGIMNEAWKLYKESPCGANAHDALFRMRMAGERCSKLRWGPDYLASYRELLNEWDTWCSKVECKVDCGASGRCKRDEIFPHDPRCHCHPHWQGESCDRPLCNPRCTNGTCTRDKNGMESRCECNKGYSGESCSAAICTKPCKNGGACVGPEQCACPKGFGGVDCAKALCDTPCVNGGECVAPDTCACGSGWEGENCNTHRCEEACENGAKCTGPNKCSPCPHRKKMNFTHPVVGNGTVVTEGFSGPTCGDGPVWVFGDLCEKCVEKGGAWCLQDGKCSLEETSPGNETCPKSTAGDSYADSTPLVATKDSKDVCNVRYRKCAKIAAPLVHLVNDPTTLDKGYCGEPAKSAISAMKAEEGTCGKMTIVSLEANLGHLNINLAYERILQAVVKARKAECEEKKPEKDPEAEEKKETKNKKEGKRASWYDSVFR